MKQSKTWIWAGFFIVLCAFSAYAEPRVVVLEKCPCSSDQASRNKTVLTNAIGSNVVVQLPEGNFSSNPIAIDGVSNLTIKGQADASDAIQTRLKILSSTGMSLTNVTNMRLEDLEIQGNATSNLVVLSEAGGLTADNLKLTTGSPEIFTECLKPNLDWLVPVISLILN
ncbi:hypothetical protein JCM14469_24160 [Desulfatiferula olefinivorans]